MKRLNWNGIEYRIKIEKEVTLNLDEVKKKVNIFLKFIRKLPNSYAIECKAEKNLR